MRKQRLKFYECVFIGNNMLLNIKLGLLKEISSIPRSLDIGTNVDVTPTDGEKRRIALKNTKPH